MYLIVNDWEDGWRIRAEKKGQPEEEGEQEKSDDEPNDKQGNDKTNGTSAMPNPLASPKTGVKRKEKGK
jgi:hypothetical protein